MGLRNASEHVSEHLEQRGAEDSPQISPEHPVEPNRDTAARDDVHSVMKRPGDDLDRRLNVSNAPCRDRRPGGHEDIAQPPGKEAKVNTATLNYSVMLAFGRGTRSLVSRRVLLSERRTYATTNQIPRPPPPTEGPPTETFSAPSRPKLHYTRPPRDDLPQIQVAQSIRYS